jgi:UDP-N-acetylmuramyl pentapeptide phosphotransferase/UDP-N-acetylglucosamine-1-phosphate transferase
MTVWLFLFLAIGAAGTWLARAYAVQRNLLDHPGERRSHATATPRGGGIAIVIALLVATLALAVRDPWHAAQLLGFGFGLLMVAGIGWWDDHRPLPAWLRLGVHAVAALILSLVVYLAFGEAWLAVVAFLSALVLTNVWNFMDGINGLAGTQAVLVGAVVAILSGSVWGWLGWAMVAATVGFLPFNFPGARIFLGDVGSGALGFTIAALVVMGVGEKALPWPLALLPLSAFAIDAGLTLFSRLVRGERWWTAHTQHAYQGLARHLGSHLPVTLGYALWTGIAIVLAVALRSRSTSFMLAVVLAWYMSGALLWWSLQRKSAGAGRIDKAEWRKE